MNNPWNDITRPQDDLSVLRVSAEHPLDLYWGKDYQERYLFVYDTKSSQTSRKDKISDLEGITVIVSGSRLALILNDRSNWELFHSLCADLISATAGLDNTANAVGIFLRRLESWREFLKNRASDALSREAVKGLIGELLLLKNQLAPTFGWDAAIEAWHGPEGAPQDFAIHTTALEVKCQSGSTAPCVKISSADQLNPQLPEGFLVVYTITTADEYTPGFTLNQLVKELRDMMEPTRAESRSLFEERLLLTKYTIREEYDVDRYQTTDVKCYELREGFPRIAASSILPGVERVSYNLKLDACQAFLKFPNWWINHN